MVSFAHKVTLTKFRAGNTSFASSNAPFTFSAAAIDCGASNVDITHYRCRLTFGSSTIDIVGAAAQQLFATLIQAGVPGDGAAGTIHEAVTALSCTVNVGQVKQRAGGGGDLQLHAELRPRARYFVPNMRSPASPRPGTI